MKNFLKQLLLHLLWVFKFLMPQKKGISVLMYHGVDVSGWEFSVTPSLFKRQMQYLKESGYTFLSLEQVRDIVAGISPAPERSAVITFDDGYEGVLTEAAPILREFNIPAVLFIHTNRSQEELKNALSILNWEQIKDLRDHSGFIIESHSHAHPNLKQLSAEEIRSDLDNAAHVFREKLESSPKFFAYPGGKYSSEAIEALRSSGYEGAYTINRGRVMVGDDPFQLKRNGMGRKISWIEFLVRVSPVNDIYERIINSFK